jgi:hypothetical protein
MFTHQSSNYIRVKFLDLDSHGCLHLVIIEEDGTDVVSQSAHQGEYSFEGLPPESQLPVWSIYLHSPVDTICASRLA